MAIREDAKENVGVGSMTRPTLWLDDLMRGLVAPLEAAGVAVEAWDMGVIKKCLRHALRFAVVGNVKMGNIEFVGAWSKLRKALQREVVTGHMELMTQHFASQLRTAGMEGRHVTVHLPIWNNIILNKRSWQLAFV